MFSFHSYNVLAWCHVCMYVCMYVKGLGKNDDFDVICHFLVATLVGSGMIPTFIFCKNFEKFWFLIEIGTTSIFVFFKKKFKIFFKKDRKNFFDHIFEIFPKFYFFQKIFFDMFFEFSQLHILHQIVYVFPNTFMYLHPKESWT